MPRISRSAPVAWRSTRIFKAVCDSNQYLRILELPLDRHPTALKPPVGLNVLEPALRYHAEATAPYSRAWILFGGLMRYSDVCPPCDTHDLSVSGTSLSLSARHLRCSTRARLLCLSKQSYDTRSHKPEIDTSKLLCLRRSSHTHALA